jgi:molecular chaperone Hsp33
MFVERGLKKMKDYVLISYAYQKQVRIYVATSTYLVEEARRIHQTYPTATAALGRFLTISAMMGLMYKGDERITLRIKGDGPIGSMLVEANAKGEVRGEIQNGGVYLSYENGPNKGKLAVGLAVGRGFIHVTKDLGMKDYFTSSSEIQTGEIADDFTYYFTVSEQTPSSVGLGVLVGEDTHVLASGGFIIQVMPNATLETISILENILKEIKPVSTMIFEKMTPYDILNVLASGTEEILSKVEIKYHCPCSKEKFEKSLIALDEKTLEEMILEDEHAEIECHFCRKKYHFNKQELLSIQSKRK